MIFSPKDGAHFKNKETEKCDYHQVRKIEKIMIFRGTFIERKVIKKIIKLAGEEKQFIQSTK